MRKTVALTLTAILLAASGGAAYAALALPDDPLAMTAVAPDAAERDAHAAHAHADARRVQAPAEGRVPSRTDAALSLDRRADIVIKGDGAWTPAAGVRGGSGTPDDPYRITGWFVDTVLIADTTACYEIAENYVSRILVLDWTGACGLVHHNHVANLRTNRNVERTGDPTAAVIVQNEVRRVQELRHFDGVLAENTIGDPDRAALPGDDVVLNIAGLNGAGITNNTVWGGVDMKLHGHHHSGHGGGPSHNHGAADAEQNESFAEDHAVRHIDFRFTGNVIHSDRFGLRYNDLDHAQDDRTATSEQEPALELPHTHHTRVTIAGNVIEGAGLRVSVFNAEDTRHLGSEGTVLVANNTIREPLVGNAVTLHDVRNATVIVRGNNVEKPLVRLDGGSGVYLLRFHASRVIVEDNTLPGFDYGVRAREFCPDTTWRVDGVHAPGADHAVYWDESVPNPPTGERRGNDADAHAEHDHDDGHHDSAGDAASRALAVARI